MNVPPSLHPRVALPAVPAAWLDLATLYPGPLAATHDLLATDGRRYTFSGDVTHGLWSRSIDPGWVDVHYWGDDGMYYFGWTTPTELHWAVPPVLAMPRWWDPATRWEWSPRYVEAHRTAAGNTFTDRPTTIVLQSVVEAGEPLIYFGGGEEQNPDTEHWWLSHSIPVRGGGAAPGFRGFTIVAAGQVIAWAEFTEWIPRGGVSRAPWAAVP